MATAWVTNVNVSASLICVPDRTQDSADCSHHDHIQSAKELTVTIRAMYDSQDDLDEWVALASKKVTVTPVEVTRG